MSAFETNTSMLKDLCLCLPTRLERLQPLIHESPKLPSKGDKSGSIPVACHVMSILQEEVLHREGPAASSQGGRAIEVPCKQVTVQRGRHEHNLQQTTQLLGTSCTSVKQERRPHNAARIQQMPG